MLDQIYKFGIKLNDSIWFIWILLFISIIHLAVYMDVSYADNASKFILNIKYSQPHDDAKSILQIVTDWSYNIMITILFYCVICAIIRYFKKQEADLV